MTGDPEGPAPAPPRVSAPPLRRPRPTGGTLLAALGLAVAGRGHAVSLTRPPAFPLTRPEALFNP
jgi:hypothetical protein